MRTDLLFEAIHELRAELEELNHVIGRVEALLEGRARRGRPPKALALARQGLANERSSVLIAPRRGKTAGPRDNDD